MMTGAKMRQAAACPQAPPPPTASFTRSTLTTTSGGACMACTASRVTGASTKTSTSESKKLQPENELLVYFHRHAKMLRHYEQAMPEEWKGKVPARAMLRKCSVGSTPIEINEMDP